MLHITQHDVEKFMKLREWLYRKRINIKEFSELIDYDRTYIHRILNGSLLPSEKYLQSVAYITMGKVKSIKDVQN